MNIACILIAHEKRRDLVRERVLPSIIAQPFDEIVVVADYMPEAWSPEYRWLEVEPFTRTTLDALTKRDIGTLATTSEWLCYLSDDHAIRQIPTRYPPNTPLIGVPKRFCAWEGQRIALPMGLDTHHDPNAPYCAGHGGLFHRSVIQRRPWGTIRHTPLWDVLSTRFYVNDGATLVGPLEDFVIEDLEPERMPWQ